jgi:DNA-binding transcriptional MerR regulator
VREGPRVNVTNADAGVLTIGEAARRAGLTPKAIRLYEARGLLPPVERTEAGYRLYSEHDLRALRFIRQARAIGLGLDEIHTIMALRRAGIPQARTSSPCYRLASVRSSGSSRSSSRCGTPSPTSSMPRSQRRTGERTHSSVTSWTKLPQGLEMEPPMPGGGAEASRSHAALPWLNRPKV